jgi:OFA family oxalate/formate antiporter-like MFS transporter
MAVTEIGLGRKAGVSKFRYTLVIGCSLLIMLCAGSVYGWSIFVTPLTSTYGLTTAATQIIYGCSLAVLGTVLIFVHRIYRRLGPRLTASIGAVFFGSGYIVASFSGGNVWILLLGISLLSGIGMALAYNTVLTNLVQWLPRHRGLGAGIAVAGFGGGSVLMTQIANPMLNSGIDVLKIFFLVGIIYGVLFLIGALFLSAPAWASHGNTPESQVSYRKLFKDKRYWVLFYTAFAASFGGLMFYGNAKPLGISFGISSGAAVLAVVLMSAGNAIGRLTWGQIYDMIGARKSIIVSLILITVLMPLMLVGVATDLSFVVLILVFGFCFGSDQVLYACSVTTEWGSQKLDVVYPLVFLAYGICGIIAPTIGGQIFDVTGNYTTAIIISTVVCFSGLPVYAWLMPRKKESKR